MVLAYHVIFGAYGFWLPNDPRGSWSIFVASWDLYRFGKATSTSEKESLAYVKHDREARLAAKRTLRHAPVEFSGHQAKAIGEGFASAGRKGEYVFHACAILPDHVHCVLGDHDRPIKQIVGHLKSSATMRLRSQDLWPLDRTPWSVGCWKVFLYEADEVERAVAYVEGNPVKEGKPRQHWSFVTPFG